MNALVNTKLLAGILLLLSVISFSCQKTIADNQTLQTGNPAPESIIAKAQADSARAPYNLNVLLQGNCGLGFIKFRQKPDTARIINLDTWVFNLKPNHA